jgi:hypothetical protein
LEFISVNKEIIIIIIYYTDSSVVDLWGGGEAPELLDHLKSGEIHH